MKVFIKNMVSIRCKMVVKSEIEKLGLHHLTVELGEVETVEDLTEEQRGALHKALMVSGLELMEDKRSILVEKIKNVIIEMVHYSDALPNINYSVYISEKLHYDYSYLSNLFSSVKGTTIEHYIISHKIEKVKELLEYDGLSLKEIAWKMDYSSTAHLSAQFKKVTGLTSSHFKSMHQKRFIAFDNV